MSERQRFQFLCDREGYDNAVAWEQSTAEIYRAAALNAADPESTKGAKGMDWVDKYCKAARACDEVIN